MRLYLPSPANFVSLNRTRFEPHERGPGAMNNFRMGGSNGH
jgi:hypothetical protein